MRGLLVNMPDLVKGLTRIQYGKVGDDDCEVTDNQASASELANILVALVRIGAEFKPTPNDRIFKSGLLNQILNSLPTILAPARAFLHAIDIKVAREEKMAELWTDRDRFPDIQDAQDVSIISSDGIGVKMRLRGLMGYSACLFASMSWRNI